MKSVIMITMLVTWQYSYEPETDKIIENGGQPIEMSSPKSCLQYIKDRTLPGTKVETFKRYKIGSSDPLVIDKEVSCVTF